jgi:parallel beta-helix repeat protein
MSFTPAENDLSNVSDADALTKINTAIATNPAATRAAAGVSSAKIKHFSDYDPDITGATSMSQLISDAINALSAGDTLLFPDGANLLCRRIALKEGVRISAYGCTFTLGGTAPTSPGSAQNGIFTGAGSVGARKSGFVIEGGTFIGLQNPATSPPTLLDDDVIQFEFCDNIEIRDIEIQNAGQDGIEIKSADNVLIEGCSFSRGGDAAIEFRNVNGGIVRNCESIAFRNFFMVKAHESGETLYGHSRNIWVYGNESQSFGPCFLLNWANQCLVERNIMVGIEGGDTSVRVLIGAHSVTTAPTEMVGIIVRENTITQGENTAMRAIVPSATSSENVIFERNVIVGGNRGIELQANGAIIGNVIGNTSGNSVFVAPPVHADVSANQCASSIRNLGTGTTKVRANAASGIVIEGLAVVESNQTGAITTNTGATGSRIIGNIITVTSGASAVSLDAGDICVANNKIAAATSTNVIRVAHSGTSITANQITQAGTGHGIAIYAAADSCSVNGNRVFKSGGGGAGVYMEGDNSNVVGNNISGFNQNIRCTGASSGNVLTGNICQNSAFQGIDIQSGATNNLVDSNIVRNSTTAILDAGTTTLIGDNIT